MPAETLREGSGRASPGGRLSVLDRWLTLFRQTALEVLPADAAAMAISRAEQMTKSFRMGLFPWAGPDGKDIRQKP